MTLELYGMAWSPPCWSVMHLGHQLGLEFNIHQVNVLEGEQFAEDFLKINPMHTIPVIVDGDYTLCESRAILQYLANKYDEAGSLYPIEPEARARVDQKLYFDFNLFAKFREFTFANGPNKAACQTAVETQLAFLDQALVDCPYVAGEEVTIADYTIMSTIQWCDVDGIPLENYENVTKWIELCKENAPMIIVSEEAKGQFLDVVALAKKRGQPAEEEAEEVEE